MTDGVKRIGLLFVVTMYLSGCSEDPQITPAQYSKILTGENSKSWIQVAQTYTLVDERFGDPVIDLYDGTPTCTRDDIYRFVRDGKNLEIGEGATKCNPDDPDIVVVTSWDIVNATTSIFIGSNNRFDLLTLTEESLVYGRQDTLGFFVGGADDETVDLVGFWQFEYVPTSEN